MGKTKRLRASGIHRTLSRRTWLAEALEPRVLLASAISGTVWQDLNRNSQADPGEPPLAGRTVYVDAEPAAPLHRPSDMPTVVPAQSAAVAELAVSGVPRRISDLNLSLYVDTYKPAASDFALTSPKGTRVVLFEDLSRAPRSLTNTLFTDEATVAIGDTDLETSKILRPRNPLSAFDGEDPNGTWVLSITNRTVEALQLRSWSLFFGQNTATTDASGHYAIEYLPPGNYTVRAVSGPGWYVTAPPSGQRAASVVLDQVADQLDFGLTDRQSIGGIVWNDINGNGQREPAEPPIAGRTIYLDLDDNGQLDDGEPTRISGPDGAYLFEDLTPADYAVAEVPTAGWLQTTPGYASSLVYGSHLHPYGKDIAGWNLLSDTPVVRFAVPATGSIQGFATTPDSLLVSIFTDASKTLTLYELNRRTGTPISKQVLPGSFTLKEGEIAWDAGIVYVITAGGVKAWNRASGQFERTVLSGAYFSLCADTGRHILYAVPETRSSVVGIDLATGEQVVQILQTPMLLSLFFWGGELYADIGRVARLDPPSQTIELINTQPGAYGYGKLGADGAEHCPWVRIAVASATVDFGSWDRGAQPPAPTLITDTGVPGDRITKSGLTFLGVAAGPFYRIYGNGIPVGMTHAGHQSQGDVYSLVDGTVRYTVAAVDPQGNESPQSEPLFVTYDGTPPSFASSAVRFNPAGDLLSIDLAFDSPIQPLSLANLSLKGGSGVERLSGGESLASSDGQVWKLSNLPSLPPGSYTLTLRSTIQDIAGNAWEPASVQVALIYIVAPGTSGPVSIPASPDIALAMSSPAPADASLPAYARLSSLSLGGSITLHLTGQPADALQLTRFSLADSATLDLGPASLILTHEDADAGLARADQFQQAVARARIGLPGLRSSTAAADPIARMTVAVLNNNVDGSAFLTRFPMNAILIQPALFGDTNLDGEVTGSDYAVTDLAFWVPPSTPAWINGDCNFDGVIDGSDYAIMDLVFWTQHLDQPAGQPAGSLPALPLFSDLLIRRDGSTSKTLPEEEPSLFNLAQVAVWM